MTLIRFPMRGIRPLSVPIEGKICLCKFAVTIETDGTWKCLQVLYLLLVCTY